MNIKLRLRALGRQVSKQVSLLAMVIGAAILGGASTAFVMAAIPSADGSVTACYNKTGGTVSAIDVEAGKTCTVKQNSITWPAPGPVLHDANGQVLGDLVDGTTNNLVVYSHTVNRLISIRYDDTQSHTYAFIGTGMDPVFESNDCSGQPLIDQLDLSSPIPFKTNLFSSGAGASASYYIVQDNAVGLTNVTLGSDKSPDGTCADLTGQDVVVPFAYPVTSVSALFTAPPATPFKF